MPWFKADDRLPDHRKIRQLGRDRLPAMGLWLLSGCWSSGALSDGFVPAEIVARWDQREQAASGLVRVGLWHPHTSEEGEDGYAFHDWPDWQPTRATVEADREAAKERQRARRNGGRSSGGVRANNGVTHPERSPDVTPYVPRDNSVSHADVPDPDPTRPDPTRPGVPGGTPGGDASGRAPARAATTSGGPPPLPSELENPDPAPTAGERPGEHWPEQPCGNRHDPERACRRCGVARRAEQDRAAEATQAEVDERAAEAERRRACQVCDPNGWVEDDDGRPIVRCDHERERRSQLADALDHAS